MKNIKEKIAFTLAEVLITLVVIGILASLTIPVLIQNIQNTHYKTAYKKAFAIANQAWMKALAENLIIERSSGGDYSAIMSNFNAFKSEFSIVKDCNNSNNDQCWAANGEKFSVLAPFSDSPAFIDSSGMSWSIIQTDGGGVWDHYLVDTNGLTGPNKFGRDRFWLYPTTKDDSMEAGLPVRMSEGGDYPDIDVNICPSGGCYYYSWLKQ